MRPSSLESRILRLLHAAEAHHTVRELAGRLGGGSAAGRRAVRQVVRSLVTAGKLEYTERHGRSVVEPAFRRPLRVTERLVLLPERVALAGEDPPESIAVWLAAGAAFGAGDHPSTRLALRAVDDLTREGTVPPQASVLDIGTGSGILAIAAVACGGRSAVAVDIDPCAIFEAVQNIRLNRMTDRIRVMDADLSVLSGPFDLILANLRYPTLTRLLPTMDRLLASPVAVVVASGLRPDEAESLTDSAEGLSWARCWHETARGWAAAAFRRTNSGGKKADAA